MENTEDAYNLVDSSKKEKDSLVVKKNEYFENIKIKRIKNGWNKLILFK